MILPIPDFVGSAVCWPILTRVVRSRRITIPMRLFGGIAAVIVASAASQTVVDLFRPGSNHLDSTSSLAADFTAAAPVVVSVLLAYSGFVRLTERRWPTELEPHPALRELPQGIALGFGLSAASFLLICGFGGHHFDGVADCSTGATLIVRGLTITAASSERLWLRIGPHGGWNFALAAIFGGAHNGERMTAIVNARLIAPEWVSGRAFEL